MIRRLLPSVLCIFLSPLLAAQQAAQQEASATTQPTPPAQIPSQITLSPDVAIRIVTPGDVPFAKIKPGTIVRFVIDRDVIVDGVKLIPASTTVDGVVEKVIHASHFRNRAAQMFIQVRETASGTATNLLLHCYNPDNDLQGPYTPTVPHSTMVGILDGAAIILLVLLLLLVLSF
jgi:hypothetical protein